MTRESTAADHKTCPMCAEDIQQLALVCRHCGYDYTSRSNDGTSAKANGLAIAAMVLGILWIYWIGSILAVIFGHISLQQIRESNGTQSGRGMAIAGLVLGYLGVVTLILAIVGALLVM